MINPDLVILAGGLSSERQVSFRTAETITNSLTQQGVPYQQIDPSSPDWLEELKKLRPKAVILALHGTFGEDGNLQAILEEAKIPFTGSGSQESAAAFDKTRAKEIVATLGVVVPKSFNLDSLIYPIVIKPNQEGSSYGVTIVTNENDLEAALALARKYNHEVLIEEYVNGKELSCAVTQIDGQTKALPVIEIIPKGKYFDYLSKYSSGGATEIVPAKISDAATGQIQKLSEEIFNALGLRQYARIDWILRDETPYFLETNTLPGMTETSLINKELSAAGISIADFVKYLIDTASY